MTKLIDIKALYLQLFVPEEMERVAFLLKYEFKITTSPIPTLETWNAKVFVFKSLEINDKIGDTETSRATTSDYPNVLQLGINIQHIKREHVRDFLIDPDNPAFLVDNYHLHWRAEFSDTKRNVITRDPRLGPAVIWQNMRTFETNRAFFWADIPE